MKPKLRNSHRVLAAVLLLVLPAVAQLQMGNDLKLNANGDLNFGYGGTINQTGASNNNLLLVNNQPGGTQTIGSNHNLLIGGEGQVNGSYYDPRFLNFSVRPFYSRNQENSNFQLVNNSSGVMSQVSLFSGSHFPGSVYFSDNQNSTGSLGLPGITGLATNGSGKAWNLSWSALLPRLPTLAVSYTKSNGTSQVYGTNEESASDTRTFNLTSAYSIAGFQMNGTYQHMNSDLNSPGFLAGQITSAQTDNQSSSLLFSVNHRLPLSGFVMGTAQDFHSTSQFVDQASNTTTHTYTGSASIFPTSRVNVTAGLNYTDNLNGLLNEPLIQQGSAPIFNLGQGTSDAISVYGGAAVNVFRGFAINANANHVVQSFAGTEYDSTQFTGTATYSYAHRFLGSLTFTGGVVDTAMQQGNSGAGLVGNVNFSRKLSQWEVGGQFGYTQSVETLVAVYNTSMYSYNASLRRRIGAYYWSSLFSGAHSGLQQNQGSSHSENVSTNLAGRRYSLNGNWGQSAGMSVLTPNGLVATPTLVPVSLLSPATVVLYSGSTYGLGGSMTVLKKLVLVMNYSNSNNSTIGGLQPTLGTVSMTNALLRYPFRKLYFNAGYTRLGQSVSVPGSVPTLVTSYYLGISRWFDFF